MNKENKKRMRVMEELRLPELQARFHDIVGEATRSPNKKSSSASRWPTTPPAAATRSTSTPSTSRASASSSASSATSTTRSRPP